MSNENQDHLEDILRSIEKIERYLHTMDYTTFQEDSLVQDGVIRNLEVIGEAIGRLSEDFLNAHSALPAHEAKSMRNFLIHQYDDVEVELLWQTAKEDIPALKHQVTEMLKSSGMVEV